MDGGVGTAEGSFAAFLVLPNVPFEFRGSLPLFFMLMVIRLAVETDQQVFGCVRNTQSVSEMSILR
jgi:hypothetical protein